MRISLAVSALLLFVLTASCLHAMQPGTDTTWLDMQTIVMADTTLIATVTAEDETGLIVQTPAGEVHRLHKSAVRSMTFAYRQAVLPPTRGPATFAYRRNWKIVLSNGTALLDVGLDTLRGDSLILMANRGTVAAPIRGLQWMTRDDGAHFWTGAGIGAAAGLATFLLAYVGATSKARCSNCGDGDGVVLALGTPLFTFAGALVGGIIGAFIPDRTAIDVSSMNPEQRAAEVERIVREDHR